MLDLILLASPVFLGLSLGWHRFRSRHRMRLYQPFEDAPESTFDNWEEASADE